MYLSRLTLSPLSPKVQRSLANLYLLHQGLLAAFPSEERGGGGRVLFRVEPQGRGNKVVVLVQSVTRPDWDKDRLVELLAPTAAECKEFAPSFSAGQRFRFRLRFNPTLRREGKRLPKLGEEEQRTWLTRKIENAGMKMTGAVLVDEGKIQAVRRGESGDHRMTFLSVLANGLVSIVDAERATTAARSGLGPAKGFGFGLLSLARY
jgi:CRISPR system Cascade subunit CasE